MRCCFPTRGQETRVRGQGSLCVELACFHCAYGGFFHRLQSPRTVLRVRQCVCLSVWAWDKLGDLTHRNLAVSAGDAVVEVEKQTATSSGQKPSEHREVRTEGGSELWSWQKNVASVSQSLSSASCIQLKWLFSGGQSWQTGDQRTECFWPKGWSTRLHCVTLTINLWPSGLKPSLTAHKDSLVPWKPQPSFHQTPPVLPWLRGPGLTPLSWRASWQHPTLAAHVQGLYS